MLLTKHSDDKKCIVVQEGSKNVGANIVQWQFDSKDTSQQWILEKVENDGCTMDTSKIYMFENVNSGLFMDVAYAKTDDGTNVWQWSGDPENPGTNNSFTLKQFGTSNMYYIMSRLGNYCLKAENDENGGNLYLTPFNTKDSSMLFKFVKNPDGSYCILTHASRDNCVLEVANAGKGNSDNVAQWEANGNSCQKWNLVEVTIPEPDVACDVNDDGEFTVADVVLLQKWLLAVPDAHLANWKAADLCEDEKLDVFDLCLMKRALLEQASN